VSDEKHHKRAFHSSVIIAYIIRLARLYANDTSGQFPGKRTLSYRMIVCALRLNEVCHLVVSRINTNRIGVQVLLEVGEADYELKAGIPGVITKLVSERGAEITFSGALIQGIWGNGRGEVGVLHSLFTAPDDVISTGQLDDTHLTLHDLDTILESFVTTLRGMYHPRIEYPPMEQPVAAEISTRPLPAQVSPQPSDLPVEPQSNAQATP